MEKMTEEKTVLQWHPAFYAGLQIELAEEAHLLEFENEHQLGTKPKEIDVLVIKKDPKTPIRKNIGRIFRTHNIIEYKSPEDYLSIDDLYKVFGYACFYKSDTPRVDQIKAKELTISYVCQNYPRKLVKHMKNEMNLQIESIEQGIYYIHGMCFPMQLIVTSKLSQKENLWLSSLTDELNDTGHAEKLLQDYQKHKNEELYESMIDIIVNANENTFKKEERNMSGALLRIMQDTIDKQVKEQVAESLLALVKDGLLSVAEAAKRLSLTEEEVLEKLNAMQ